MTPPQVVLAVTDWRFPRTLTGGGATSAIASFSAAVLLCWVLWALLFAACLVPAGHTTGFSRDPARHAWSSSIHVVVFLTLPVVGAALSRLLEGVEGVEVGSGAASYRPLLGLSLGVFLASSALAMALGHDQPIAIASNALTTLTINDDPADEPAHEPDDDEPRPPPRPAGAARRPAPLAWRVGARLTGAAVLALLPWHHFSDVLSVTTATGVCLACALVEAALVHCSRFAVVTRHHNAVTATASPRNGRLACCLA